MQSVSERSQETVSRAQRLVDRRLDQRWDRNDTTIIVVAAFATVFVHPVHAMLTHSYWLDESWVAALTKAPFSRLTHLSASAPAGFIALLKLVPGSGLQRARLVPLGFAVLSVVMAYVFTRALSWGTRADARFGAVVATLVVMLAPLSLRRNDLKQYTCDAFCALVLLTIGAWAERDQRRSRLAYLAGVAVIAIPFSSTSAFVSVAMFAGLLASALLVRDRRRALEVVVAGGVAAIGLGSYLGFVVLPTLNPKLKAYWATQYLSGSPLHIFTATWNRLLRFTTELSMPLPMFIVLFFVGIAVLVKLRASALAITLPFLWIEMALMGRLHKYPYLDLRTSHFLFVVSLVVVAIGAAGFLQWVANASGVFRGNSGPVVAIAIGGIMALLFTWSFAREVDQLQIPNENVRAEVVAVADRHTARDVVLVNSSGTFGLGYYWPDASIDFRKDTSGQGFRPEVRGLHAVYAHGRTYADVLGALRTAVARWRSEGGNSRLFIVRTHVSSQESAAWKRACSGCSDSRPGPTRSVRIRFSFCPVEWGDFDLGSASASMGPVSDDPPNYVPSDPEPIDLEPIDLAAEGALPQSGVATASGRSPQWAPGWYADPWVAGQYRMWNGEAWTGETGRAGPGDTVPPVAPVATPTYAPAAPPVAAPVRAPRSGRTAAIVAAIVVLVLVAGAIGYAIEASTESDSTSTATVQPTPTTTPGSVAPAPSTADRSALSSLVVRQSDVDSARTVVLIPDGNRTTEPTLDLCNGTFPSEKLRVARLQVAELNPTGNSALLSTEAVTYKHAAGGAQAFTELRKVRAACPHQPVTSPVGGQTDETTFKAPPDRSWPSTKSVERLAYSFTTTSAGTSSPSIAVYLRRGRVLMGVYFPRPNGVQPAVAGKTTIEGIVGVFEARMAKLPAKVVNG